MMIEIIKITSLEELMRWREEVINNVFGIKPDTNLLKENRKYYKKHISDNSHIAFVSLFNGIECGCGSVCFSEELPSPDNPSGRCAYLMNIYVRKEYRNNGIGHQIITKLIEEATDYGCDKIFLETTIDGRKVYRSLGFIDMTDMMVYGNK